MHINIFQEVCYGKSRKSEQSSNLSLQAWGLNFSQQDFDVSLATIYNSTLEIMEIAKKIQYLFFKRNLLLQFCSLQNCLRKH
jgi:hypothetical protein